MKLNTKPIQTRFIVTSDPDGEMWVEIRQATFNDSHQVRELSARTSFLDTKDGIELKTEVNQADLMFRMIFLTLVGIGGIYDAEDEHVEIEFLKFREQNGRISVAHSEQEFRRIFGQLPDEIVEEIYQFVLDMNPQWDNRRNSGN